MVPLMLWEVSSDKPCLRNLHVGMLAHFGTASQMVSIHPNGFSTNLWDTVGERFNKDLINISFGGMCSFQCACSTVLLG
jgi:hypothetical protein